MKPIRCLFTLIAMGLLAQLANAGQPAFRSLASHYPRDLHPCDETDKQGRERWQNQCAIRLSMALNGEGTLQVSAKTYSEPTCRHGHARGAQELANWLKSTQRLGRPKSYAPSSAARDLAGRKGIVFIQDCFTRADGTAGDHIDLWDGRAMKSAARSLLAAGEEVWFWPLSQ